MYILTQNEMAVFDFDKYGFISSNSDGEVYIGGASDTGFLIGQYKTVERAKEVIMDIYINIGMGRYEMPLV